MPMMPVLDSVPEASSYISYWDFTLRAYKYIRLLERDFPLRYPKRISSVAPGSKTSLVVFDEIDPSEDRHHLYLMYLGVYPETQVTLFHPFDVSQLRWDDRLVGINENLAAVVTHEESPADAPTKAIWVSHDRYPGIEVRNIGRMTAIMKVLWVGAKFRVLFDDEIDADSKNKLVSGEIFSKVISLGGEF